MITTHLDVGLGGDLYWAAIFVDYFPTRHESVECAIRRGSTSVYIEAELVGALRRTWVDGRVVWGEYRLEIPVYGDCVVYPIFHNEAGQSIVRWKLHLLGDNTVFHQERILRSPHGVRT